MRVVFDVNLKKVFTANTDSDSNQIFYQELVGGDDTDFVRPPNYGENEELINDFLVENITYNEFRLQNGNTFNKKIFNSLGLLASEVVFIYCYGECFQIGQAPIPVKFRVQMYQPDDVTLAVNCGRMSTFFMGDIESTGNLFDIGIDEVYIPVGLTATIKVIIGTVNFPYVS